MRLIIFVVCFLCFCGEQVRSDAPGSWGYTLEEQKLWGTAHKQCFGKRQSPVKITTSNTVPLELPVVELVEYYNPLATPLTITNNGHTALITPAKYNAPSQKRGFQTPYIFGGPLTGDYELEGIHFHWGDRSSMGSEHVINSQRYSIEMHIVHRNKKYPDMAKALANSDGLAVVAVFYQVVEHPASGLKSVSDKLAKIRTFNSSTLIDTDVSLSDLIEGLDHTRYYTYFGSLTTPPCAESVTWIVYPDALPISMKQMWNFRRLRTETRKPLVNNYRALQSIYRRKVFRRVVKSEESLLDDLNDVEVDLYDREYYY